MPSGAGPEGGSGVVTPEMQPREAAVWLVPELGRGEVAVAGDDPRQLVVQPQYEVDERWVEQRPGAALELGERLVDRPRGLVGPRRDERVEDVRDGADAPDQRDLLAAQAARVAGAVPALVVRQRDLLGHAHDRRAAAGEDLGADRRVPPDRLPLARL